MSVLQYRRYQKRDADLDAVAASGVASSWTAYTPTIASQLGSFTTANATGRYLLMGKITFINIKVTITTNGTASGYVTATVPTTPAVDFVLTGREMAVVGHTLFGFWSSGVVLIQTYDGLYPAGSGYVLLVDGTYEVA